MCNDKVSWIGSHSVCRCLVAGTRNEDSFDLRAETCTRRHSTHVVLPGGFGDRCSHLDPSSNNDYGVVFSGRVHRHDLKATQEMTCASARIPRSSRRKSAARMFFSPQRRSAPLSWLARHARYRDVMPICQNNTQPAPAMGRRGSHLYPRARRYQIGHRAHARLRGGPRRLLGGPRPRARRPSSGPARPGTPAPRRRSAGPCRPGGLRTGDM